MEIKTFSDAQRYLESLPKYKRAYPEIGMRRMRALAKEVGDPQDSYPTIQVGGTAGKGSTATMIASIFQEAGYKTGLHLSPHLEDIRERAQINGRLMGNKTFVDLVNGLSKNIEIVGRKYDYGAPTYFEASVALAFKHFKDEKVDAAVIEVGLGGMYDGTSIITPKVAVLTNVGLDHTEILGDTVEKIASDKAGIFKENIVAVSGVTQPSVIRIVKERTKKLHCELDLLGRDIKYKTRVAGIPNTVFDLVIHGRRYNKIALSAIGEYQVGNAALAIDAALKLEKNGFNVTEKDIRAALGKIKIPGRFEIIKKKPIVVLDAAHSPMKIQALAAALKHNYNKKPISFVFAVKKDKDAGKMLGILDGLASKFYLCRFQAMTDFGSSMSSDPKELQTLTKKESQVFGSAFDAYEKALAESGDDGIVCVTGSIYLVGELRAQVL